MYEFCAVCLRDDITINKSSDSRIKRLYCLMTGDVQDDEELYFCNMCAYFMNKIETFRAACVQSRLLLKETLQNKKTINSEPKYSPYTLNTSKTVHTDIDVKENFKEYVEVKIEPEETFRGPPEALTEDDVKWEDEECDENCDNFQPETKKNRRRRKKYKESEDDDSEDFLKITARNMIILSDADQTKELEERRGEKEFVEAKWKCIDCGVIFNHIHVLDNHMKKHDKSHGSYECWLCRMRFSNLSTWRCHERNHAVRLVCHMCPYKTHIKQRLLNHLKWHAGYSFACRICGETFEKNHQLELHEKFHRNEGLCCSICSKVFKNQEDLNNHEHATFACDICNKFFKSRGSLFNHLQTHSEKSDEFYCVECNLYFKTKYNLTNHFKSSAVHKDPSLLRLKCDKCPKKFETEEQLSAHIESSHDKIAKHSCEICGSHYVTKQGLNFHRKKVHLGFVLPLKYECSTCDKKFSGKASLDNHMRKHTGERPFECNECDWKFTQRSSLKMHTKLKHTKRKERRNRKTDKKEREVLKPSINFEMPVESTKNVLYNM